MSYATLPDWVRDWFDLPLRPPADKTKTTYRWELTVTVREDGDEQTATDSGTVTVAAHPRDRGRK